ncbi:plasminogen activator inhibitor 2, macrophage [Manduca sexta]|uniref:plasminogen activator inhibitor 2, macrophage n=1 Tax=Manduca sexta TaxID=7130 RepID=UPI00188E6132|nr:plasminogen activator inhibitor 2, macrophage [Manduca sexta]
MRSLVLVLSIVTLCASEKVSNTSGIASHPNYGLVYFGTCGEDIDITQEFRRSFYEFTVDLYQRIAVPTAGHFVFSPLSIWMSLAALAEGSDGLARQELFKLLRLPEERCIRQQFYALISRRELLGDDVILSRTRLFIYDEKLVINKNWDNYVCSHWLVGIIKGTLRKNPKKALQSMRDIFSAKLPNLDLNGNSVILDALDYDGLWTTAFLDSKPEIAPFYNDLGEKIGTVEMMRLNKRVRMSYNAELKMKILDLPVGQNGRYRFMFGVSAKDGTAGRSIKLGSSKYIFDIIQNRRLSKIPIDVAIPKFTLSSEIDIRSILEELKLKSVWTDPWGTKNISEPAALPSGFVQRVTIELDRPGLKPCPHEVTTPVKGTDKETGLEPELGKEFIANKPFLFAFFDTETFTVLFAGVYSKPGGKI